MATNRILLTSWQTQAALAGRLKMVVGPVNRLVEFGRITEFQPSDCRGYDWTFRNRTKVWNDISHKRLIEASPFRVGQELWGAEAWLGFVPCGLDHKYYEVGQIKYQPYKRKPPLDDVMAPREIVYKFDLPNPPQEHENNVVIKKWSPAITMPRWASRFSFTVTGVGVGRVQDLTEEEAVKCGVERNGKYWKGHAGNFTTAQDAFRDTWWYRYGDRKYPWATSWGWKVEIKGE